MKSKKRALRRHHRQRMQQRALRIVRRWFLWELHGTERLAIIASRWRDNLQKCSCRMCGNQRRYYGPTLQEQRRSAASDEHR